MTSTLLLFGDGLEVVLIKDLVFFMMTFMQPKPQKTKLERPIFLALFMIIRRNALESNRNLGNS